MTSASGSPETATERYCASLRVCPGFFEFLNDFKFQTFGTRITWVMRLFSQTWSSSQELNSTYRHRCQVMIIWIPCPKTYKNPRITKDICKEQWDVSVKTCKRYSHMSSCLLIKQDFLFGSQTWSSSQELNSTYRPTCGKQQDVFLVMCPTKKWWEWASEFLPPKALFERAAD